MENQFKMKSILFFTCLFLLTKTNGQIKNNYFFKQDLTKNEQRLHCTYSDSLLIARQLFVEGDYEKSKVVFSSLLKTYGNIPQLRYHLAMSLMNLGEYGKAIKEFEKIEKYNRYPLIHWVRYNKALCYLRQKDTSHLDLASKELKRLLYNPNFSNDEILAIQAMIDLATN